MTGFLSHFSPVRALKFFIGTAVVFALSMFVFSLFGATSEGKPATGLDRFTITSFDARYQLLKEGDGSAQLRVTERIRVDFGANPSNHGILRSLPTEYLGSPTRLTVDGVTDGAGERVRYSTERSKGAQTLKIGDPDEYVNSDETYVITYRYQNVARTFRDGHQELYWDVNGQNWPQQMKQVSATIEIDPSLTGSLTGQSACYVGNARDSSRCAISRPEPDTFTMSTADVKSYSTMTYSIGFTPGTFKAPAYNSSPDASRVMLLILGGLPLLVAALMSLWSATRTWRAMRGHTLLAQFLPRKDLPPVTVGNLYNSPGRGVVGELLSEVLAGRVRLTGGGQSGQPLMAERLSQPDDHPERSSRLALELIFGRPPKRLKYPDGQTNEAELAKPERADVAKKLENASILDRQALADTAVTSGLIRYPSTRSGSGWLVFFVLLLALFIPIVGRTDGLDYRWMWVAFGMAAVGLSVIYGLLMRWWSYSKDGRESLAYAEGMREYISMAEADRMAFLQGAQTAERVGPEDEVKIYEKLLPYAVALGLEDTWQQAMGARWQSAPPSLFPENFSSSFGGSVLTLLGDLGGGTSEDGLRRGFYDRNDSLGWRSWNTDPATAHEGGGVGSIFSSWGSSVGESIDNLSERTASESRDSGGSGGGWWTGGGGSSSSSSSWSSGGSSGGGSAGGGGGGGGGGGW